MKRPAKFYMEKNQPKGSLYQLIENSNSGCSKLNSGESQGTGAWLEDTGGELEKIGDS